MGANRKGAPTAELLGEGVWRWTGEAVTVESAAKRVSCLYIPVPPALKRRY